VTTPVGSAYLLILRKRISGWLTDQEGVCQLPPGQGVSQLGTLPERLGKSLSDSWNTAPRRGAVLGQRPSLAPLLGITLQQAASASHGAASSTTSPVFPGGEQGPPRHPWAVLLGQPELQSPTAQMAVLALQGAHGHRSGTQEGAASQTTSLMWAMVPTALIVPCTKCSRR